MNSQAHVVCVKLFSLHYPTVHSYGGGLGRRALQEALSAGG